MRSDSYETYIKTLNASEPFPPFGEIRELVMQQEGRRKAAFVPFYKYAAVAVLFAALGVFVGNHFFVNEPLPKAHIIYGSDVTHTSDASHVTQGITSTEVTANEDVRNIATQMGTVENAGKKQFPTTPALATATQQNIPSENTPHSTVEENAPQSSVNATQAITIPMAAPSVSTSLTQLSDQNGMPANHWEAFVAGGAFVPGNSFTTSSIFGAAGVRYQIFSSSSLVVELRRSAFVVNHAARPGGLQDTTFSLNGVPYTNTIGTALQPATTSTSMVNSLDVGYRFDWNPNAMLTPCAEILAGASTTGFLSSEAVGIEYRLANALSLDISARSEQLFSPASTPLTALGLEAGIGFEW